MNCTCSTPKACKEGDDCFEHQSLSKHCLNCGRPIREEKTTCCDKCRKIMQDFAGSTRLGKVYSTCGDEHCFCHGALTPLGEELQKPCPRCEQPWIRHDCPIKELEDCSGCTDPRSEGTHQMQTKQHPEKTVEEAVKNGNIKISNESPVQEPSEGFKKALESLDWQGIAEVFAQADTKWHAGEWRAFIEKIKADERTKIVGEIAGKMRQMQPILWNDDPNKHLRNIERTNTLDEVLKVLEDYKTNK